MSYLESLRRWDAECQRRVTMKRRVAEAARRKRRSPSEPERFFLLSEPEVPGKVSPPGASH